MRHVLIPVLAVALALGACGGDDDDATGSGDSGATTETDSTTNGGGDEGSDGDGGGAVVDPAPAGQATASLDGQDFTFDTDVGGCSISDDSITFGFAAADGVTTLAGGMNRSDDTWAGSILLRVPSTDGEGFVQYDPTPVEANMLEDGSIVVDGSSMSYSGPIRMQPPNDGSRPPPVEVGDGTISATC